MRYFKLFLFIAAIVTFASCHKCATGTVSTTTDIVTLTGTLQKQGFTTYQYGTHILVVNPTTKYVLESNTVDLNPYVGAHVTITAINTHYHAEQGPEMYNVTSIALAP
jgi:hypothetical protein